MSSKSPFKRTKGTEAKLKAAAAAISKARNTVIASRRMGATSAPIRTGGFYGPYNRPVGLGPELKVIDTSTVAVSPIAVAGATALINGVAQSSDYTGRIGRKVTIKSILFRATLLPITSTTAIFGSVSRLMLIYDKQTNGNIAAVTDILNAATYLQPANLNNRDRFKILMDKFVTHDAYTNGAGTQTVAGGGTRCIKKYIRCNHDVVFGGTGATVGDIQSGSLIFLYIGSTAAYAMDYNIRTRFIDN